MADEPTTPAATATAVAEPPAERTVPYDRFKQVNDQLAEAKRKADEAEQKRQELEDRDKSELEQVRGKLEKAEKRNAELQGQVEELGGKLTSNERSGWVREAASKAKFIDATDALGRVDLSAIENEDDAKKAVADVAKSAPHLVAAEEPTPPPVPGRVVVNGQPVTPGVHDPAVVAAQQESEQFLQELKEASSKGWSASGTGLLE